MRVLLISGDTPVPAALREVIARGSTALIERAADAPGREAGSAGFDRIVFWAAEGDAGVRAAAEAFARARTGAAEDTFVYITPDGSAPAPGFGPADVFTWPGDEDRLRMAFMTSA